MISDPDIDQYPGTDATTYIQWKGTNVCIDMTCRCGAVGHFDGGFAYFMRCPACGTVYRMGTAVKASALDPDTDVRGVSVQELDL